MLEIPESHTMGQQLNQTIKGKTIKKLLANSSPHNFAFYSGDPALYNNLLAGKTIGTANSFGGLIEMTIENTKMLFGDGLAIRFFASGEKIPPKHQLYIEFNDHSSLICTVQIYGGMWVYADGKNDSPYYLQAKEKPSPLSDQFNEKYFSSLLSSVVPKISVKAFLATAQRIPGLGNGVLQDILFKARLNPKQKMSTLSSQSVDTLFTSLKQTIQEMAINGGRDTEKDLFGNSGGYKTILSKKTLKKPCPVCAKEIVRQAYMGGNVYFCPICQPI